MAAHGAADAAAVPLRPAPRGRSARGRECDPLHRGHGMPVARAAEGFSTVFDGSVLLLHMAWIGLMALGQRRFGPTDARKKGRKLSPSAGIIDSQTVKTTES